MIDWLRESSFSAAARRLGLTWDEVDGMGSMPAMGSMLTPAEVRDVVEYLATLK
jgi:hypothetical protein